MENEAQRTAIVTGGSRGIGAAIVHRLLHDGFNVVTCGRGKRPDKLHASVHWQTTDVSEAEQAQALVTYTEETFGSVDVLVNNAGVQVEKSLLKSTDADWDAVVGVNCKGVFNMSRACLHGMVTTGGNIVNIGSISGNVADETMALYNASKAFVHGLTRSIALDHGPAVRCNAIQPGWIMTEMAADAFALADDPDAAMRSALQRHPVGRFGQPDDIANMVSYLVSDQAQFVSGQCFTVDGGMTAASPLRPGLAI